jgi:hypothetical protein
MFIDRSDLHQDGNHSVSPRNPCLQCWHLEFLSQFLFTDMKIKCHANPNYRIMIFKYGSDQNFCCHCDIEMIHLVQMMNLVFFLIFNQHYHFLCLDCLGLITVYKFAFLSICHNTLFQMSCYEFVLIILRMLLKSTKHTCDTSLKVTTEVII